MKNVFVVIVVACVALAAPVFAYFGVTAYAGHREASIRHADLQRQQRELRVYSEQVLEYRGFAGRVERFVRSAQAAGVADERWNRHRVEIKNRVVSFAELARLVDDAAGGDSYYFLPSELRIRSPGAGTAANPFAGRAARASRDEVTVSLTGDFLVPIE